MNTLIDTVLLITKAHKHQTYDNYPYTYHLLKVAEKAHELAYDFVLDNPCVLEACLLHDILEETLYTRKNLENLGYSKETLDIVDLVTKDTNLSYEENITRIIDSNNVNAAFVKYCDNLVNLEHGKLMSAKLNNRWAKSAERLREKYAFS